MDGKQSGRVMGVDWGGKRIGLATSDETCTIAKPLLVFQHRSKHEDAMRVLAEAEKQQVNLIIIGVTYDDENNLTPSGRRANRFAEELGKNSSIPIKMWSEEFSTSKAKQNAIMMNLPKSKRKGHLDAIAAANILQDFLDLEKNE